MVITMELIAEIRRRHFVGGESISALSRSVGLSRPTVRKHLLTTTAPVYSRAVKPGRRLGCFEMKALTIVCSVMCSAGNATITLVLRLLEPASRQNLFHLPFRLVRRVSSTGVKNVLRLAELSRPSKSHISVWRTAASVLWLAVHGNAKRWCLMLMPMFE